MTYRSQLAATPGGIFFLGEAPSHEDCLKGYPLVDSQGILLSRALRAAGLVEPSLAALPESFEPHLRGETRRILWERRSHSFATLFDEPLGKSGLKDLCQPARVAAEWKTATGYNLPPLADGYLIPECLHAIDRLTTEIQQTRPNLIVALGPTALWAITGENSIETFRGAIGAASAGSPGTKYIATYDPHHVGQRFKFLTIMIGDFVKARAEAQFPEVRPQEIELWLDPTLKDLDDFYARHISASDLLSIDIETGGGQISCVGIGTSPTTGLVLPFVDYRQPDRSYWSTPGAELKAWDWLSTVLDTPTPKLMQNGGAFDVFWFLDKAGLPVRNYRHDLRLVHHVLLPELPKSLAFMGATYTNLPSWKAGVHHDDAKRDA